MNALRTHTDRTQTIPAIEMDEFEEDESERLAHLPVVQTEEEFDELFVSPTALKIVIEELRADIEAKDRQIANLEKYNAAQKVVIAELRAEVVKRNAA